MISHSTLVSHATIVQDSETVPNGREVQTISQTIVTASESSNIGSDDILVPNGNSNVKGNPKMHISTLMLSNPVLLKLFPISNFRCDGCDLFHPILNNISGITMISSKTRKRKITRPGGATFRFLPPDRGSWGRWEGPAGAEFYLKKNTQYQINF